MCYAALQVSNLQFGFSVTNQADQEVVPIKYRVLAIGMLVEIF